MSILLIFPKADHSTAEFGFYNASHPPLSLCYLSSYLKKHDIKVKALDLNYSSSDVITELIIAENIQIVGFSITTFTFENAYNEAQKIKKKYPHIKIVFGGMPVQLYKDRLIEEVIDVLIIGEGEETLVNVARHYLYDSGNLVNIANLIYYKQGQIIETPRGVYKENINDLPHPDRDCFDLNQYATVGNTRQCYISTSRACPYSCIYCLSGTLGHKVRLRSVDNVIEEIRTIKNEYPFYNKFHFVDETLNVNNSRFRNLCHALKIEKIRWSCMLRADDHLDNDTLELMKESGVDLFEIGLESASQMVLDSIKKGTNIKSIERILIKASELKIPVIGTIMIPHCCDTPETIDETVRFIKTASDQYSLIPFPIRTNIHPRSEYNNYTTEYQIQLNHLNEIISTKQVSEEIINHALKRLKQNQIDGIIANISHFSMNDSLLPESLRGKELSALVENSPFLQELLQKKIKEIIK